MATIDITTQSGAVGNGDLQLQNGAPMDATLRFVTDAVNTASPLKLSTSLVQTTSTLQITTNDNPYIDAEDGAGNNRFTVGRATSSQQVNVDFASNPTGSTTAVGAIRTYRDNVNLSEAMTFIEDGSVGIGTTAPVGILDLFKSAAATRLAIRGDAGQNRLISYRTGALQRFGLYVNNTAESGANAGSNFAIRAYSDAGTLLSTPLFIQRSTGNVGMGTTAPYSTLTVGTTDATAEITSGGPNTHLTLKTVGSSGALRFFTIGGTTSTLATTESMRIASTGNVGIGTASPVDLLSISKADTSNSLFDSDSAFTIINTNSGAFGRTTNINFNQDDGTLSKRIGTIAGVYTNFSTSVGGAIAFSTNDGSGTIAEKARITSDGFIRMAASTGGIQFNGDTAAANALDDYEEGTFTPSMAFGGGSTGVTYFDRQGNYTKIGRQVTCTIYLALTSKGSSTGVATITGLPFTSSNANRGIASGCSFRFDNVTYLGQVQMVVGQNSSVIDFWQTTELGTDSLLTDTNFGNASEFQITATYFV